MTDINKNMVKPLVSVVTPFYNTATFLHECIQSVLTQSYQNFEYILVDNCSTDGSYEIALGFAATDSRITLVKSDGFVGQIANYNRTVARISSESTYTKFVEADNWLYPDCLEKMVALAENYPSVDLVGAYNTTEQRIRFHGGKLGQPYYSGREAVRLHYQKDAYLFGSPTTVLFRSSAIRCRVPFFADDGIYAEDLRVCYDILRNGDFGFVPQILTFVRTENESILSAIRRFDAMSLDRLILLWFYGKYFLTETEFSTEFRRARRNHYARVGKGLVAGKGKQFWRYHNDGLRAVGLDMSKPIVGIHCLRHIAAYLANPGNSLRDLWRMIRCQSP